MAFIISFIHKYYFHSSKELRDWHVATFVVFICTCYLSPITHDRVTYFATNMQHEQNE